MRRGREFLLLAVVITLAGCAKAKPTPGVGFIPQDRLTRPEGLPFHKAWFAEGVDWSRYTQIQIGPVNTNYLLEMEWLKSAKKSDSIESDIQRLAEYTQRIFKETFQDAESSRFEVVESPGPSTLVLEIALVEVIPSKLTLNTLGYAPLVGIPIKLIRAWAFKSSVAFEARVRDGSTGETIALLADREAEKTAFINVKDLSWYGHAESILWEWARQFAQVLSQGPGQTIKDSKAITLKPW